ncbi:hypothetical protein SDC9_36999 [bioreactor metagenome]|uniref:Uncharacterized protein n=1 Tax=bioreactor metagenome TaxID=1076179 RepID=A0A644VI32_9ZZZZ|nr:hypothetical protein [Lentimicrobium sp.]MEA5110401.1 hypothetical protein [Lentimicrobium sp.]
MSTITVKKAKLKDRSLEVNLEETINTPGGGSVTNEILKKCNTLVHDDLIAAFDRLKVHMVKACDFKKSELITGESIENFDLSLLSDYRVKGFSIGGQDDNEGVVLIGSREFASGKILNIITPFIRYADEVDPYEFAPELADAINAAVYEVEQYLFENKYAIKQLEIPFDEEDQENSEAA